MSLPRVLWVHAGGSRAVRIQSARFETSSQTPDIAVNTLKSQRFDAVVLEFPLPPFTPLGLLEQLQPLAPDSALLIRDPQATVADALRLARHGIAAILEGTTTDPEIVLAAIQERTKACTPEGLAPEETLLIGTSREMQRVSQIIRLVGARRATVLITGETGTGKELAARSLHRAGPRGRGPWVAVNCSALPGNLLEAELFGHVKGAFTGAVQSRAGRFEQAQGGTLLLDEIGELPLDLQAKLLRVLQEREFQRLGSSDTIRADVRVVAATNCDLAERIEEGRFREDLYYRLNVVPLHLPPLRQRTGDIPLLALHFAEKICRAEGILPKQILPSAMDVLCRYSWPGNVRQLENAVEMAAALSGERHELTADDFSLPAPLRAPATPEAPVVSVPDCGLDYARTLAWIERSILEQALKKTGGNKKAAAAMLRLKRTTLSAKVRSLAASAA